MVHALQHDSKDPNWLRIFTHQPRKKNLVRLATAHSHGVDGDAWPVDDDAAEEPVADDAVKAPVADDAFRLV